MDEGDRRTKKLFRNCYIYSGAIVSDCNDLLTTILLQLPAKTLVRLKLVSRQFNYVISDPIFGINHVRFHHKNRKSLSPTGLYFYNSFNNCPEIYSVSLSEPASSIPCLSSLEFAGFLLDRQFKIVQSCNGLLLCSFDNENSSTCSARLYCVCNPTTHAFTMLPELPPVESSSKSKKGEEDCHPVLALAFNPFESSFYNVFAVRIVKQLSRKCTCELLVYSSNEGGRVWRKAGSQFPIPKALKRIRQGVFHDGGKITFICEGGFIHFDAQAEKVIEVTKRTKSLSTWKKIRFLGESIDGNLQLIIGSYGGVYVQQLRPETLNWGNQHNIRLRCHFLHMNLQILKQNYLDNNMPGYCSNIYQILAVVDGGKEMILAIPGMVLRYCHAAKKSWMLRDLPLPQYLPEDISFGCVTSFQFVATLAPV